MTPLHSWQIPPDLDGQRLDLAAVKLTGLSRKKVRQIIDSGGVFLNQKRIWIAKFAVHTEDVLELRLDENESVKSAKNFDLTDKDIIVENNNFLVLNKPPGVAVDSTPNNILAYLKKLDPRFAKENLQLAHRLDKDTSGLLIITKNEDTRLKFEKLFAERKVHKTYRVICFDTPNQSKGTIRFPIVQHSKGENKYFTITDGSLHKKAKLATTRYKLLESLAGKRASYLECYPHSGRPHQIRVHLRAIGNPVLGDKIYGEHLAGRHPHWQTASRHMLHAFGLDFDFQRENFELTCLPPQDFEDNLELLRAKN